LSKEKKNGGSGGKLAEAVRQFPVLYASRVFKDDSKKEKKEKKEKKKKGYDSASVASVASVNQS